jgi:hypothetical protein
MLSTIVSRDLFGNPRLLGQVFRCFSSRVTREKYKLSSILMVFKDPSGCRTSQNSANHYFFLYEYGGLVQIPNQVLVTIAIFAAWEKKIVVMRYKLF